MKAQTMIVILDLPEKCSCGGEEGIIIRSGIEGANGELLSEVECRRCRKRVLIPDKNEEELRKMVGEKYRPTWYYQPVRGEIVQR